MKNKFLLAVAYCYCLSAKGRIRLFVFCLFVGGLPTVIFAQTPNFTYTQTCFGNQTTLAASSSLADTAISSWMWDVDGNGSYDLAGKTIITLVTLNDTVAVRLKITPNSGAPDSITKNVVIDPLPQVNFMANNLCESKAAEYVSQSSIAPGSISQFIWDFNNDGTDDFTGNDTAYYTCGPAATYVTKLRCVSAIGCSAFTQKVTTVYPNPTSAFTTANACANDSALFMNTSTVANLDFYLWTYGDGNNSVSNGNATHIYTTAGTYTVSLVASTLSGCRDTAISTIVIDPLPVISISGNNVICLGDNATLTATGGTTYLWNTSDATATVIVGPSATTTYSVTATLGGCSDMSTANVMVNPLPVVSITASSTTLPPAGGGVALIANGAINYSWNTGASTISISTDSAGMYIVTGTDMNGCMASDTAIIGTGNTDTVSVTGFIITPNDDNMNDMLIINNISAYSNCELMIYNIWNDEVYSVNGYKNDWKGTNGGGSELPAGSYYYLIKCDDKPLLKGNINILR